MVNSKMTWQANMQKKLSAFMSRSGVKEEEILMKDATMNEKQNRFAELQMKEQMLK